MNKIIVILFLFPFIVNAQQANLQIEGQAGNLYLTHTAAPKESFYSIGRLYNISPKEVAPYNKLVLENGLSIGQTIKIPLNTINFAQANKVAADEVAVPLYHNVQPKETLFQLSTRFNKIPVASIKQFNNLKDDVVSPGQNIVVGYLKVKKTLSSFAQQATQIPAVVEPAPVKETAVVVAEKPQAKATEPMPAKVKETVKVIEEQKPTQVKTIEKPITLAKDFKEGTFKPLYSNSGKQETGPAGIFKSTSGWEDGKYYCLHNDAEQNSIVKITNPTNGKFIYAKVLDVMPDLKQNENLTILISNAAADVLGFEANGANCKINY